MQRDPRDQEILNEKGEYLYSCVFKAAICVKLPQAVTSSTGFGLLFCLLGLLGVVVVRSCSGSPVATPHGVLRVEPSTQL